MTSQIIGNNRVALFLQEEELAEHGLCKVSSEGKEMKKLVVAALKDLGVQSDGNMEIEIFNGKEGILVFAVVGILPSVSYMVFDHLESFIEAVGTLGELPMQSKLTYYNNKYWLEMRDFENMADQASMQLGEFGTHLKPEEYREYVLAEYGTLIAESHALDIFQEVFYKAAQ